MLKALLATQNSNCTKRPNTMYYQNVGKTGSVNMSDHTNNVKAVLKCPVDQPWAFFQVLTDYTP